MDTVVLSSLLFNTLGVAVLALGLALAYCLPNRHRTRNWVLADAAPCVADASVAMPPRAGARLPHAA